MFIELKKRNIYSELWRLIFLKLGFYSFYFWDKKHKNTLKQIKRHKYDLVLLNEIKLAPILKKIDLNGVKLILDAHEYSPENYEDDWIWRFFYKNYIKYLCKKFLKTFDLVTTVSEGISQLYKKNYSVEPYVIRSISDYNESLQPSSIENKIKLIHHGIVSSSRQLELLIDLAELLGDSYELYLMLIYKSGTKHIYKRLKQKAKDSSNIYFLPPVKRENLVQFCNQFDLGIIFFPPRNLNLKHALPNKFFEMIQSRLGIIVGPDYEMSPIVKEYNLGIVSNSWNVSDLAEMIKNCSNEKIYSFKENSHKYSMHFSSSTEMAKLLKLIENIF